MSSAVHDAVVVEPDELRRQSDIEGFWQAVPRAGRPWLLIVLVPLAAAIVCLGMLLVLAFAAPWLAFRRVRNEGSGA